MMINDKQNFRCYINNTFEALVFIRYKSEEDKSTKSLLMLVPFDGVDDSLASMLYPEVAIYFKMWREFDYPLHGDRYSINFSRSTVCQWHNGDWCDPLDVSDEPPVLVKYG